MIESLTDPSDPIERQNEKLLKIVAALMRRVEEAHRRFGRGLRPVSARRDVGTGGSRSD